MGFGSEEGRAYVLDYGEDVDLLGGAVPVRIVDAVPIVLWK